jgi:hypothetical protein
LIPTLVKETVMPNKSLYSIAVIFLGIGLLLSACGAAEQVPESSETVEPEPVLENPTPTETPLEADKPIPDDEATQLM